MDVDPSLLTSQLKQSADGQPDLPMAEPLPPLLGQPIQGKEDENPNPKAKKSKETGCGKSCSKEEDFLITKTFADSCNGVGNKSDVFQQRMKEH